VTPAQWIVLTGTIFTGIATCLTAYAAVRRAKAETNTQAEIDCLERLRVARREADEDAAELYKLRRERRGLT
jgi:hypothetical protein